MAIGLGRMMGFEYLRNFNYPYISKSVAEFWRRWHISLYTFFRDYIYIPLGGSRVSTRQWILNIIIVWTITGLWHGAAWHYVLWGVYYGVLLICEKLVWGKELERAPGLIRHLYTIALFVLGWLLFWAPESQLFELGAAMLGAYGLTGSSTLWELTVWEYFPVLLMCVIASTPIAPWAWSRIRSRIEAKPAGGVTAEGGTAAVRTISAKELCSMTCVPANEKGRRALWAVNAAVDIALIVLFVLSASSILTGSYNPFIYFQF